MSKNGYLLGLDLGTTNTKACAVETDGRVLLQASHPTEVIPVPTGGEIDPKSFLSGLDDFLQDVLKQVRAITSDPLLGIAFAGMAEAGCLITESGTPRTPILLWHDRRGEAEAEELRPRYEEQILRIGGIRLTNVATVYKLRYLHKQMFFAGLRWIGVPELAAYHLSGIRFTDKTLAVRYGAYDFAGDCYSREILSIAGLPEDLFPPAVNALKQNVRICPQAAAMLDVSPDARVFVAGHDDIVSAFGADILPGEMVDSVGTAEAIVCLAEGLPDPLTAARKHAGITPYYTEGTYAVISGVGTTGNLSRQLKTRLGLDFAEIDALAALREPYPAGAVRAEVTPKTLTEMTFMEGLTPAQTANAAYDLIADAFADRARNVISLTGEPARIRFVGGGAASAELCARKAARIGNIPFECRCAPEPAAYGAAVIAMSGLIH